MDLIDSTVKNDPGHNIEPENVQQIIAETVLVNQSAPLKNTIEIESNGDGKLKAINLLENILNLVNFKFFLVGILPILYLFPKTTLITILSIIAFCLGIIVEASLVGKEGTAAYVLEHFNRRIKRDLPQLNRPVPTKFETSLLPELDKSLNNLIDLIVRDFITR